MSVDVHKNIREESGSFTIMLPPSGPNGANSNQSWSSIITLASLVIISMMRDQQREIVMIGIVTNVHEDETWNPKGVLRSIQISGQDLSYYFQQKNWASLAVMTNLGTQVAAAVTGNSGTGVFAELGLSYFNISPAKMATNWFVNVMEKIMAFTIFPFKGDSFVNFPDAVGFVFEEYGDFIIPFDDSLFDLNGTWMAKFQQILQFPFYEFFITTLPTGYFGTSGGNPFTAIGVPGTSTPCVVGRVNPLPYLKTSQSGGFGEVDMSRWNKLPLNKVDTGYISSQVEYNVTEVHNFYLLNPTLYRSLIGVNNSQIAPFLTNWAAFIDSASIHRYGYRPKIVDTTWLSDSTGVNAKRSSPQAFGDIIADLNARVFSYYEPTPLMMSGTVRYPLQPSIFPGTRFEYIPRKNDEKWMFYVEGVTHHYAFGQPTYTDLSLARGLPVAVYSDQSRMKDLHRGNMQILDGVYTTGVPPGTGAALEPLRIGDTNAQIFASINPVYVSPGKH